MHEKRCAKGVNKLYLYLFEWNFGGKNLHHFINLNLLEHSSRKNRSIFKPRKLIYN